MTEQTPPPDMDVPAPAASFSRRSALGWTGALGAAAIMGPVASAEAAPRTSRTPATAAGTAASGSVPRVLPTPQSLRSRGPAVPLTGAVTIIVGAKTDPAAQRALTALLEQHDVAHRTRVATTSAADVRGTRIVLGTAADNPVIRGIQKKIAMTPAKGLAAEGYALGTGTADGAVAVLEGVDAAGTYYAVQTLAQLLAGGKRVPGVQIRDWPLMPIRGAIEGFYGIPWSHRARLDQFAFYGPHKLNTYIYTPKDDPLLRAKWRDLYQGTALTELKQLVRAATAHHVSFTYAISPGNDITYGSHADFRALTKKFDQLHDMGVTSFYVALDDIPTKLNAQDAQQFSSLATAQTHLLNRVQKEYVAPKKLQPLQTVPTEYWGSKTSAYKKEFGATLDTNVLVQWTGEGVFSAGVTNASVTAAVATYQSEHLYIWDNFPVNDGMRNRLFLNPLEGRAADLHILIDGFTSNPMIEPYASLPALATYADYTWNGPEYDAQTSISAAFDEIAGSADSHARSALDVFVDLNVHWPYREGSPKSPALSADMAAFWAAQKKGNVHRRAALENRLAVLADLPRTFSDLAVRGFAQDVRPWAAAASQQARAVQAQIAMLRALDRERLKEASRHAAQARTLIDQAARPTVADKRDDAEVKQNQIVPSVGDGRFSEFFTRAWAILRQRLPHDPSLPFRGLPATGTSTMGQHKDDAPARMTDNDPSTLYWSARAPKVGDSIRIDLKAPASLTYVLVQMADHDETAGDQIYHGVIEASADGTTWTTIGTVDGKPRVEVRLAKAVRAAAVRVRVTAANPGGKWVKVREFAASTTAPPS